MALDVTFLVTVDTSSLRIGKSLKVWADFVKAIEYCQLASSHGCRRESLIQ